MNDLENQVVDMLNNPSKFCLVCFNKVYTREANAIISGPPNSFYYGSFFVLGIKQDEVNDLCIVFKTRIYHPNVCLKSGQICLQYKNHFLRHRLETICQALIEPHMECAIEKEIAKSFYYDKEMFAKNVQELKKTENNFFL